MGKLKYPTYKRFITGPLERFDARNTMFSRNRREEMRTLGETNSKPLDKFRHLSPKVERKGYEQKDYAQTWVGMTIDQLVRRNLYCRDLEVAKTKVDVSDKSAITQQVKTVVRWIRTSDLWVVSTEAHSRQFIPENLAAVKPLFNLNS